MFWHWPQFNGFKPVKDFLFRLGEITRTLLLVKILQKSASCLQGRFGMLLRIGPMAFSHFYYRDNSLFFLQKKYLAEDILLFLFSSELWISASLKKEILIMTITRYVFIFNKPQKPFWENVYHHVYYHQHFHQNHHHHRRPHIISTSYRSDLISPSYRSHNALISPSYRSHIALISPSYRPDIALITSSNSTLSSFSLIIVVLY